MKEQEKELIEVTYYTDPLCCWSWAFEPQWRKLRYEYSGLLKWRYRMGGMLPDWESFSDPMNSVSRPLQMGPVWLEAKHISGMPMQEKLWYQDPPSSSYPACLAVKTAGLQSPEAGEWYLRGTREALMLQGKNIAKQQVLLEVGEALAAQKPRLFDQQRFVKDLKNKEAAEAFRQDIQQARYHRIGRFPTLTIQKPGQEGVILTGYRPYAVLLDGLRQVAPDIQPTQDGSDEDAFRKYWGQPTNRELQELA